MGKDHSDDDEPQIPARLLPSKIKNKCKRSDVYSKFVQEKNKEKKERKKRRREEEELAKELGEVIPPKQIPRTIDNAREADETVAQPDDDELYAEDAEDEFSSHFMREKKPKILITTCKNPTKGMDSFITELLSIIPSATYYKRKGYLVKQIIEFAKHREFTSMIVLNENHKKTNGMLLINLPDGPSANFKISNIVLRKKIQNHGAPSAHMPELILNNFTTRLGHRVGRMFASVFPQDPEFKGRKVVTFHNQRDYIFFRHHRYIFEEKELNAPSNGTSSKKKKKTKLVNGKEEQVKKNVIARLQECGPRFTLKLVSLQNGTFDSKTGEYEWVHKADMDTTKRRFFL